MALATFAWGFTLQFGLSGSYTTQAQSQPPALDYYCLDGHLLPTVQQPEGAAARQGEGQADFHCKVQTARYLNALPQGYLPSKGYKLG